MGLAATDPSSVNGPWWLGFAAGGVFAAAGLAVGVQETPVGVWVGPVAMGLVLLGFAAIGNWIAFGAGPRACGGGVSFLFFSGSRAVGELECRAAFGVGAVIIDGLLVTSALKGVAKLTGPGAWSGRLDRAADAVLFLALSPVLLLATLLAAAASFWSAVRERMGWGRGDGGA